MTQLVIVTTLFLIALGVLVWLQDRRVSEILARNEKARAREARERWEIMTRLQAPALMAQAPIPPPVVDAPVFPQQDVTLNDPQQDEDQDDLVGRVVGLTNG